MSEEILRVPIRKVRPFKGQPREIFDSTALDELSENIKTFGQLEPVLVRRISSTTGEDFELINGERRYRALVQAGIQHIDILVKPVRSGESQYALAVICEAAKVNLSPVEMARVVRRVWNMDFIQKLAERVRVQRMATLFCRSESWVRKHLALDEAPEETKSLIKDKVLPVNVTGPFLRLPEEEQRKVAEVIKEKNLSTRHAASFVKTASQVRTGSAQPTRRSVTNEAVAIEQKVLKGQHLFRDLLQYDAPRFASAFRHNPEVRERTLETVTELITWLEKVKIVLEKLQ